MAIREVEVMIDGVPHTVQVNDDDKNYPIRAAREVDEKAKAPENKARTPRNKAAKPATNND